MEFEIKDLKRSINDIMRTVGYQPSYYQQDGRFSIVRLVGKNDYPRFHLYVKQNGANTLFDLHLDQKRPSYEGQTGHSGEYDGEVIIAEAERIRQLLNS